MDYHFIRLKKRGLIHIEGTDRIDFLQNLVTNDMALLRPGHALYACLLNAQGKFLHDFFISGGEDFLLLDCEGGQRARDLYNRLNLYRLRADVRISLEEDILVYAGFGTPPPNSCPDPRHAEMGWRSFEKPQAGEEKPFENWDRRRIMLTVPDGSRDMIPEKSTLLECNIDRLNGVSFKKGCFVGQEITARVHYRGIAKKHLYTVSSDRGLFLPSSSRRKPGSIELSKNHPMDPVLQRDDTGVWTKCLHLETLPASGEDVLIESKRIGEMRSSCGDIGLALLKDDATNGLARSELTFFQSRL